MSKRLATSLVLAVCALLVISAGRARAEDDEAIGFERTPPRLGFIDGEASFWRLGAEDWGPARVNTALAAGDELSTGEESNLGLQIGERAFARAGENTQFGLTAIEPDFLQLRVTSGRVSLDLRSVKAGQTFELGTPNAAFTVERPGYYRVEVDGDTTTFTCRRGGRATLTPAAGESFAIAASEQVVVSGTEAPQIESYAAPELDAWDRWNYARTEELLDAVSARYVPAGVYGVDELDRHGDWRIVSSYGAVWVPRGVAAGWVPYSTGRWIYDPFYGWTWIDDAPWGWAPYHYGRWVRVSGHWAWCPGPLVARAYYAPALVAFYGGGGFSIGVTLGTPSVGWVALGWGEPLVPWWGPAHFRERAHWAGWAGPRVFNKVRVTHSTVYRAKEINFYENYHVHEAIVQVDRDRFGRYSDREVRYTRGKKEKLSPLRGDVKVMPDRSSLLAGAARAAGPPRELSERPVVAMREPQIGPEPQLDTRRASKPKKQEGESRAPRGAPPTRVVKRQGDGEPVPFSKRAPYGQRSEVERRTPPPAPRFQRSEMGRPEMEGSDVRGSEVGGADVPRPDVESTPRQRPPEARPEREPRVSPEPQQQGGPDREQQAAPEREQRVAPEPQQRGGPDREQRGGPERAVQSERRERATAPPSLPGEPANRVYRGGRPERREATQGQEQPQRREPTGDRDENRRGPRDR